MNKDFFGVHWMLVTPFDEGEEVDTASIPRLVEKAREADCSGVVALGVTGETARLTDQERALVTGGRASQTRSVHWWPRA